jgi:hypothetical protein
MLDAWREQDADRLDPIRFHFIEALERRAAGHGGEARRILDDRLSKLIEAYADDFQKAAPKASDTNSVTSPSASARGAIGGLIDYIGSQAARHGGDRAVGDMTPRPALFPALEALDEFKKIWSRVRTESQLRQTLEQAPTNAGPLNSGNLVHRSITLMRELSPEYLQQFLSYVDALSWIEQMNDGGALAAKNAPRAVNARKPARRKPRERRE